MKRLILTILILLFAISTAACGGAEPEAEPSATATAAPTYDAAAAALDDEGGDTYTQIEIGFAFAGTGAFYDQLTVDINSECAQYGYAANIKTAADAEEQTAQISAMLQTGVAVIVIDPVDVDALEAVLAECETQNVPVINVIDSINGLVSTLIAPDYISIGKSAGRDAVELFGSGDGNCMVLKTDYGSFTMQLMSDGFMEEIDKDRDVSLVSDQFCGDDEESAYIVTKAELLKDGSDINFIFAQSDSIGLGALRAIEELEVDVKLVVFGADMRLVSAAAEERVVRSCIFFGPQNLAQQALFVADKMIQSDAYEPNQYIELRIEAAEGTGAQKYVSDTAVYAQITGG